MSVQTEDVVAVVEVNVLGSELTAMEKKDNKKLLKNASSRILTMLADHFVLLMENKLMFVQTQDAMAVVEVSVLGSAITAMLKQVRLLRLQ